MAIIRWDPFRDLITIREKMNRLFEDAVTSRGEEKDMMSSSWSPSVDIFETENELVLTAEVPGIDEKDIEIKLEDNTLTLKGERKFEKETKEENYHRIERAYGSFFRSFTLPTYLRPRHQTCGRTYIARIDAPYTLVGRVFSCYPRTTAEHPRSRP